MVGFAAHSASREDRSSSPAPVEALASARSAPPLRQSYPDVRVRNLGLILLPMVFLEGAIGIASAGDNLSGVTPLLATHIVLGGVLVFLAGAALRVSQGVPSRAARLSTALTALALWGTAVTGAGFLATEFAGGAGVDRVLALLTTGGSVMMILHGSVAPPGEP